MLDLTKEDLTELTWIEDNHDLTKPRSHEVGKIRSSKKYRVHSMIIGIFHQNQVNSDATLSPLMIMKNLLIQIVKHC